MLIQKCELGQNATKIYFLTNLQNVLFPAMTYFKKSINAVYIYIYKCWPLNLKLKFR